MSAKYASYYDQNGSAIDCQADAEQVSHDLYIMQQIISGYNAWRKLANIAVANMHHNRELTLDALVSLDASFSDEVQSIAGCMQDDLTDLEKYL